jgi:hypothetical protein
LMSAKQPAGFCRNVLVSVTDKLLGFVLSEVEGWAMEIKGFEACNSEQSPGGMLLCCQMNPKRFRRFRLNRPWFKKQECLFPLNFFMSLRENRHSGL